MSAGAVVTIVRHDRAKERKTKNHLMVSQLGRACNSVEGATATLALTARLAL
jgi:hypothetical protein